MECLFCKIVKKEISSKILYEDELIIVILDAYPDSDGHTLIIPKKHYNSFLDLPDDLLLHINKYAKIFGEVLLNKLNKQSLTILTNYGDEQVIKHYHLHLLPNRKDKVVLSTDEVYEILTKE